MISIGLERISKRFGDTVALADITLEIAPGELFFLLGPSGCGKSTLLRIIAGLQTPSSGRILFNGRDVTDLPTEKRNAVMCFQSYALWPHMSVRENVGFGLETQNWPRERREARIDEVLKLVRLDELGRRKPNELSGGQQQRVALARALAVNPACLLLDEPLSNLDAQLRLEMRGEIRRMCKSAEFTTVYVTHDQREALSVADRIALLDHGRLVQMGTPEDLYLRPVNSFTATFVGQTNLIPGEIVERDSDYIRVQTAMGILTAAGRGDLPGKVIVSIRPERLRAARDGVGMWAAPLHIAPGFLPPPVFPGEGRGGGANEDELSTRKNPLPASPGLPGEGKEGSGAEHVMVLELPPAVSRFDARLIETTFLGESSEHLLEVAGQSLRMISAPPMLHPPENITVEVDARDIVLLRE
jgi:iron(III) transport system ATP-binding protein